MTNCNHTTRIKHWTYSLIDGNMIPKPSTYDCLHCGEESTEPFPYQDVFVDHSNCKEEPCFGCKARYLQLSVGDARHDGVMSAKQHDKELGSYFDAVRQGIEPISTKQRDIDAAVKFSNEMGTAFDGNKI